MRYLFTYEQRCEEIADRVYISYGIALVKQCLLITLKRSRHCAKMEQIIKALLSDLKINLIVKKIFLV